MKRADLVLAEKGHAASRSEAQAAIRAGLVKVNGEVLTKPSRTISEDAAIEYRKPHPFVSRGGIKLAHGLAHFGWDVTGTVARKKRFQGPSSKVSETTGMTTKK